MNLVDRVVPPRWGTEEVDWLVAEAWAEPRRLTNELWPDGIQRVRTGLVLGASRMTESIASGDVTCHAFLPGRGLREAADVVRYERCSYFEIATQIADQRFPFGGVAVRASLPDESGFLSLGNYAGYVAPALEYATAVVAEIDPHLPRLDGAPEIHVDRVTMFPAPPEPASPKPSRTYPVSGGPVIAEVARLVASLVPNEAVLEVGIGGMPAAVLIALSRRRQLRVAVWSGVVGEEVIDLADAGILELPDIDHPPIIVAMVPNSPRLASWAQRPGILRIEPITVTHDPARISQMPNFVAINGAISVDLSGNVNSERAGGRLVSGPGGAPNFAHGARRSRGGRSIIALPSSARNGLSSIVADLDGQPPTIPASDITHIVTEHGVAEIDGTDPELLAERLIGIAAPTHRDDLRRAARRRS